MPNAVKVQRLNGGDTVTSVNGESGDVTLDGTDLLVGSGALSASTVAAAVNQNATNLTTLDAAVVKLTGNQTIAGVKTFSSIPVLPGSDPTTANQAVRKSYVDARAVTAATAPLSYSAGTIAITPGTNGQFLGVVGGTVQFTALPPAPQGAAVADATDGTDVITQFNALLASLRAAGIIAT